MMQLDTKQSQSYRPKAVLFSYYSTSQNILLFLCLRNLPTFRIFRLLMDKLCLFFVTFNKQTVHMRSILLTVHTALHTNLVHFPSVNMHLI